MEKMFYQGNIENLPTILLHLYQVAVKSVVSKAQDLQSRKTSPGHIFFYTLYIC